MKNTNCENELPRLSGFATGYGDQYFLVYRSLFKELQSAANKAVGRLLDIGCGNKPYEKMFTKKITEYVGCDVAQSSEKKVDIICPATAIAVADASFDTALCTQVIEHVADHRALLRETYRILRNNGVLILSAPMYWHLHEDPRDFFRFTEYGLRWILEQAGFTDIKIIPNGGEWALCGQVLLHCLAGKWFYNKILVIGINWIFSYLDDRFPNSINHINYVVVARKP